MSSDPSGGTVDVRRDERGEFIGTQLPTGVVTTWRGDASARVIEQTDTAGLVTRIKRDQCGIPVLVQTPVEKVFVYTYDVSCNVCELVAPQRIAAHRQVLDSYGRNQSATRGRRCPRVSNAVIVAVAGLRRCGLATHVLRAGSSVAMGKMWRVSA
jgi:YD repeat-containing protein